MLCLLSDNRRWALTGVSSWRIGCSKPGTERPRLYDKISSNLAWIKSTIDWFVNNKKKVINQQTLHLENSKFKVIWNCDKRLYLYFFNAEFKEKSYLSFAREIWKLPLMEIIGIKSQIEFCGGQYNKYSFSVFIAMKVISCSCKE